MRVLLRLDLATPRSSFPHKLLPMAARASSLAMITQRQCDRQQMARRQQQQRQQRRHSSGPPFSLVTPEGDDKPRRVCATCGFVDYQNPKIIVGSVPISAKDDRVLLVKRKIAPRKGYWAIPGGFMECGESVEVAAAREALEEANAIIQTTGLLAMYSLPHISQVHMIFSAELHNPEGVTAGDESEEVGLFLWEEVPWQLLAFPTTSWALMHQLTSVYHRVSAKSQQELASRIVTMAATRKTTTTTGQSESQSRKEPPLLPLKDYLAGGLPPFNNPLQPIRELPTTAPAPPAKTAVATASTTGRGGMMSLLDAVKDDVNKEERPKGLFWSPLSGLTLRQF